MRQMAFGNGCWVIFWEHVPALRLVVCSLLFTYIKWSRAGYCVQSQLTNLSRTTDRALIHYESVKSLRPELSLLFLPLVMGIAMCFLWENTLKILYGSRQSYVRSGTSVTTCGVVSANILYIFVDLIHGARHSSTRINCLLGNSKHRSRAISRLSKGRKIHALSCNIDYRDALRPCSRSPRIT